MRTLDPIAAKGKREPLEAWLAKEPLARTWRCQSTRRGATPLVGRGAELGYLTALLDKTADSVYAEGRPDRRRAGHWEVSSRAELFACVDASARLVTWRQGRCLPYGEGVTFWALAEIIKAMPASLRATIRTRSRRSWSEILLRTRICRGFVSDSGPCWVLSGQGRSREENFTAWLRFFEEIARRAADRPHPRGPPLGRRGSPRLP